MLPVQEEEEVFSSHEKHETTIFGWAEYTIHDSVSSIWIRNDRASRSAREEDEGGYPAGATAGNGLFSHHLIDEFLAIEEVPDIL